MANSIFTNNKKIKVYFICIAVIAVISLAAAVGSYFYFGRLVDGKDLNNNLEHRLYLGGTFTLSEVAKKEKYEYAWLSDGGVEVEVYAKDGEEESKLNNELLSYDYDTQTFTVIGIGEGYIRFNSKFDYTVSFSVPFTTKFSSVITEVVLKENYPAIYDDGMVLSSELSAIKSLVLQDKTNVDFSDVKYFDNLEKVEIKAAPNAPLISISNFNLPEKTNVYVPTNQYVDYISRDEGMWRTYSNRVFPSISSIDNLSVVLHKNGGAFEDDNGATVKAVELTNGQSLNLSEDYAISRLGYQFEGWFLSLDGKTPYAEALTDNFVFTKDVKLCALWTANTYTVRMHSNNAAEDNFSEKVFTYDGEEAPLADEESLPSFSGFIQIGWAVDENARDIDYENQQIVQNLTAENGAVIDIYAIWVYENFKIQYYTWNDSKDYVTHGAVKNCVYGEDIALFAASGEPGTKYGGFKGWSLTPYAPSADYTYNQTVNSKADELFRTSKESDVLAVYAVFEEQTYDLIYEADGGEETPSRVDGISRGAIVYLSNPIEKEGYKFMGWTDDSGYIWIDENRYLAYESFYSPRFTNKIKFVEKTQQGYKALAGVETVSSSQVTLTAVWRVNEFDVIIDSTNANSVYDQTTAQFGQACDFYGETKRTGWSWSLMNSDVGNVQLVGETLSVEQVRALYLALLGEANNNDFLDGQTVSFTPNWSVNSYIVSFNSNGGGAVSSKTVTFGTQYGSLPTPSTKSNSDYCDKGCCYTYYSFSRWEYNNQTVNSNTVMNVDSNHTLKAVWSSKKVDEHCLASGTLITMADGTTKKIEDVSVGDMVLSIDHETGELGAHPVTLLIDHGDKQGWRHTCKLYFDDGSEFKIIGTHSLFDLTLNSYVVINLNNPEDYLNHEFFTVKTVNGASVRGSKKLVSYEIYDEYSGAYTIMTGNAWNVLADGLLTIPSGEDLMGSGSGSSIGLLNVFEFDENLKWNEEEKLRDIETYGLCDYSEFSEYMSEKIFDVFYVKYFKIMAAKDIIDMDLFIAKLKSLSAILK